MKVSQNNLKSVFDFFAEELQTLYTFSEIQQLFKIVTEEYTRIRVDNGKKTEDERITESEMLHYFNAVKQLKKNIPIQYIVGYTIFYGLKINLTPHVLIPRPETEELVELIISELNNSSDKKQLNVLDIGTGSGCISLALKNKLNTINVSGMDYSAEALKVAAANAAFNNIHVNFFKGDILNPDKQMLNKKWDVIVSNPPYVTHDEKNQMAANVLEHEPHLALFVPDTNPLLFYSKIIEYSSFCLNASGYLFFEINKLMGDKVKNELINSGYSNVQLIKDMSGNFRFVWGKKEYI